MSIYKSLIAEISSKYLSFKCNTNSSSSLLKDGSVLSAANPLIIDYVEANNEINVYYIKDYFTYKV